MRDFPIEFEGDQIEFQRRDTENNFEIVAPYYPSVSYTSTLCKLNTVFQEIFVLQKFSDSSISTKLQIQNCSLLSHIEEQPSIYSNTTGLLDFVNHRLLSYCVLGVR